MRIHRFCRPTGGGVVLLFALTVGLLAVFFRFRRGLSLAGGDVAVLPRDGGDVAAPPERGGSLTGDAGVPLERRRGSAEIDELLKEEGVYDVLHNGEDIKLQHLDARVRKDAARGEYLNRLVEASALDQDNQVSNVAFFKTHKTGSTTMAILLNRYGRRHDLQVAHFPGYGSTIPIAEAAKETRESQNRLDIMHYHIDTDTPKQERWAVAKGQYADVMRDPDKIHFITLFREPRDRLLSFYTFFIEFETLVPIEEFFRQENPNPKVVEQLRSLGCKEFGVETEADLDEFIRTEIPQFELILITERFDEGLLVLRNLLRWHLVDMTYISVNKTAGRKGRTGVLKDRSPFEKLPKYIQDKIDELTVLDKRLYDAGVAAFEKKRAAVAGEVEADLEQFEKLQTLMNEYLRHHSTTPVFDLYRYKNAKYYENPPPMANFWP